MTILCVFLVIVLLVALVGTLLCNHYCGRIVVVKRRSPLKRLLALVLVVLLSFMGGFAYAANHYIGEVTKLSKPLDEAQLVINKGLEEKEPALKDYKVIALFGVDNQDNAISDHSRTDCIMIAAINKNNHEVKLMSVYRDTYVSINGNYDKVNAAYAKGGPELALSTLNRNLDLNITDYATINFKGVADVVDAIGGITLEIKSEKELQNLNDYIGDMNRINGGHSKKFKKVGKHKFDGNQAVAYARIRYMAGGDHERAHHQRVVLTRIAKKIKKHPLLFKKVADALATNVRTSLSEKEIRELLLPIFSYKFNAKSTKAYPFDSNDVKYNGIYYGFPTTVRKNVAEAHKFLFGTEDYHVTKELGKIADKIKEVTDLLNLT